MKQQSKVWLKLFLVANLIFISHQTLWAWSAVNGVAVCTAFSEQEYPAIVSDGFGGAIITWQDYRNTTGNVGQGADTYAQRLDSTGAPVWTLNGIAICTATSTQYAPVIASDGAGGAIITWFDYRDNYYAVYSQRVDSNGSTLWANNGVAICTVASSKSTLESVSDGIGGAITVWEDYRNGNYDIYAQRVDSTGSAIWTPNGLPICTDSSTQIYGTLLSDGTGGGIFSWTDSRNGLYLAIYAQRVNSEGSTLWTNNGIPICTSTGGQVDGTMASDSAGGVIITWIDARYNSQTTDIFAERIDSNGNPVWAPEGVAICTSIYSQRYPVITTDGASGAIICWQGYGYDNNTSDLYAQRVDSNGNIQWQIDGVAICTAYATQNAQQIISDGLGGAIITWQDFRSTSNVHIYAQWVNALGTNLLTDDGYAVCTAKNGQQLPVITTDGANGSIIAWFDGQNYSLSNPGDDIYAQQISAVALVPVCDWFNYAGDISILKRE